MAEYIERSALLERLKKVHMDKHPFAAGVQFGVEHAIQCTEEAPAADVAPVVHGHWIKSMPILGAGDLETRCSVCGRICHEENAPYCCCGAKMD